jgi:hypothetical protein
VSMDLNFESVLAAHCMTILYQTAEQDCSPSSRSKQSISTLMKIEDKKRQLGNVVRKLFLN